MSDFKTDIKASKKQWIKFSIASILYILFSIWLLNFWILIGLVVIFDIYITKYVPWTWWKNIKNQKIRKIFEWADAILFALVAVYFINLYLFQNYKIPTGSLEKTLLIGDHLFVSKIAYGPRTPNTPLSFPLMQHTVPLIGCKSYIESVQWKSRRLAGLGHVKRFDIVVFNFPGGDTVVVKRQAEDYEGLCYQYGLGRMIYNGVNVDSLKKDFLKYNLSFRDYCIGIGRMIIYSNPQEFGSLLYRPVDRRENYVKRCIALPGETLQVINREVYINGKRIERPKYAMHFHKIVTKDTLTDAFYDEMEINNQDRYAMRNSLPDCKTTYYGKEGKNYVYYIVLTKEKADATKKYPGVISVNEINRFDIKEYNVPYNYYFPAGYNTSWSDDNYGPIWIPKAGATVALTIQNLPLFERVIRNYEGNKLEVKGKDIYINGKKTNRYTFAQDYYWMMGDNRHNSADSRVWGYVPEDHIVGQPLFVWLSLDDDRDLFSGKIRFNRFFKDARR